MVGLNFYLQIVSIVHTLIVHTLFHLLWMLFIYLCFAGVVSSSPSTTNAGIYEDYPSVMYGPPNRRRLTEQEWEDSKAYWTKHAMSDLVSSPGFSDWITDNADRIRVVSSSSTDEVVGSDSDSTEEIVTGRSSSMLRLFNLW